MLVCPCIALTTVTTHAENYIVAVSWYSTLVHGVILCAYGVR